MFRLFLFLLIVLALGLVFAWVADRPGVVTIDWLGQEISVSLMVALTALILLIAAVVFVWGFLQGLIKTPTLIAGFFSNRRRHRGYDALSRGLIAASSGDVDTAKSLARESGKLLKNEPLVSLLATQAALLEGRRDTARANFQSMLENENTRLVAIRGLFLEAERQGEPQAARHYAEEAARLAPALPWAGKAKLRYQVVDGEWDDAIETLEANRAAGLIDKEKGKRERAVLLTAKAISIEPQDPDTAKALAREAHKLAKDLVPAAVIFASAASRLGDVRGATRVLEATWKLSPHPEISEAYLNVRTGDSVQDRLKRAKRLASLQKEHVEGALAVAAAAIDAMDWNLARQSLEPVLLENPTERACLLMAEVEEGEHGDKGRTRDWLARAVRANADPVWTADGQVSEAWLPISPVTGELDAFEWKVPVERLGGGEAVITIEELTPQPKEADRTGDEEPAGAEAAGATIEGEEQPETASGPEERDVERKDADALPDKATTADELNGGASEIVSEGVESDEEETMSDQKGSEEAVDEEDPNKVKFPLERRPDDPGVDPDEADSAKGFKLF